MKLPLPLKKQYEIESALLKTVVEKFPWESPQAYADYLGQSYFYARESTRILAAAGAKFGLDRTPLHKRFLDHAREEMGHDVLLVSDLKHLGRNISDFKEMPLMAAFYHNLYYWIDHVNPISLFGWVLNLEGYAVDCGPYLYARALKAHGPRATAFFKVHSEDDVDHLESALSFINGLPENEVEMIRKNYEECSGIWRQILLQITEKSIQSEGVSHIAAVA